MLFILYIVVHEQYKGYNMHLSYKTSKYKDKIYKSYSIAESYREGNKVKKRTLIKLGKLTALQAEQIRKICKITSNPDLVMTTLEDVVVDKCKSYGSLAIANALWKEWKLSKAFKDKQTDSELSTAVVANILTINRCVDPCSHYSIPRWVEKTSISEMLNQDFEPLNDDKIYYELDKIDQNQRNLEDHLFRMTYQRDKESYQYVNYDLTTSYFVGFKCELSNYGHSKDQKPNRKQVLLGIFVNNRGYPFKWDVYPGNMSEVNTLVENIDACTERFKLRNINVVFDRGIVSNDNLTYIDKKKLKYITALDKDQIPQIETVDLSVFDQVNAENFKEHLLKPEFEFKQYDDSLLYKDLGDIKGRRYVLGFNPTLFEEERKNRHERIECFEKFLVEKNQELKNAKRSRNQESTKQSIVNELKRLKIKKYFGEPELKEIRIERINKNKDVRIIKSFQVTACKKDVILASCKRLDGVCAFVSNHIEKDRNVFCFAAEKIISAYRDKNKIENAFKHIKSFLKIRPFYVNTDAHVRAVYSINVLAYFINKDLAERRKKIDGIDYLNSKKLYEPFEDYYYTTIKDKTSGKTKSEPMKFNSPVKHYLTKLGIRMS